MSTVIYAIIELGFTFAISLFFAAVAIDKKTLLSCALAIISWLSCGVMIFLFDPFGFGGVVCWIFFAVGAVFIGQLFYSMYQWFEESRNSRFEVSPL